MTSFSHNLKKQLSICLPTYNRPEKAFNLILAVDAYLKLHGLDQKTEFIISDNSDGNQLKNLVSGAANLNVQYHKQIKNIGYDNNIIFLKYHAQADYLFYIADDDDLNLDVFQKLIEEINDNISDIYILNWGYYSKSTLVNINKNMDLLKDKYSLGEIINYPLFYFLPSFCVRNIKSNFIHLENTMGVQMEIIYNYFTSSSKVRVIQEIYILRNDQVQVGTGCAIIQDWLPPLGFLRIKNKYRAKFNFQTPVLNTIKFSTKLILLKLFSKNYNHVNLNLLRKNLITAIKELV